MLVTVEANPVAETMREELVVWTETSRYDYGTGCVIDGAGKSATTRGVESGVLCAANQLVGAGHFFSGLAEDSCSSDVRGISFQFAAAIDEDDITFLERMRLDRAVRKCGGWSEEDERVPAQIHLGKTGFDKCGHI